MRKVAWLCYLALYAKLHYCVMLCYCYRNVLFHVILDKKLSTSAKVHLSVILYVAKITYFVIIFHMRKVTYLCYFALSLNRNPKLMPLQLNLSPDTVLLFCTIVKTTCLVHFPMHKVT